MCSRFMGEDKDVGMAGSRVGSLSAGCRCLAIEEDVFGDKPNSHFRFRFVQFWHGCSSLHYACFQSNDYCVHRVWGKAKGLLTLILRALHSLHPDLDLVCAFLRRLRWPSDLTLHMKTGPGVEGLWSVKQPNCGVADSMVSLKGDA